MTGRIIDRRGAGGVTGAGSGTEEVDAIAVSEGFKLRFEPARDDSGAPIETWLVWGIEWPADGYLRALSLPRSTMPPMVVRPSNPAAGPVPCRGSGPWRMSSKLWIGYRDCSLPDLSRMSSERWIARPPAPSIGAP